MAPTIYKSLRVRVWPKARTILGPGLSLGLF